MSFLGSFIVPFAFAIIYNVPSSEYLFCSFLGFIGWASYLKALSYDEVTPIIASIISSITITFFSRVLANYRKKPVIIFVLPGIITLVPGVDIFNAMFSIIDNDYFDAIPRIVEAFKTAGFIGLGIVIIFTFPERIFKHISSILNKITKILINK